MQKTNFVGLVNPTCNNAFTMFRAFTMAEILLSLTIIGVVAAITLPSLMANINERTWNTQRKALYARMSQAIGIMPGIGGYGVLKGTINADGSQVVSEDTAAETFLTEGLSKVLKINNICDSEHLADCGLTGNITALNGSLAYSGFPKKFSELNNMFTGSFYDEDTSTVFMNPQLDAKAAAFETQNGESLAVFYNPNCQPNTTSHAYTYMQSMVCANFIYDLNGNKGPNTAGKDVGFITVLYSSDSVVTAPVPLSSDVSSEYVTWSEGVSLCKTQDIESRIPNVDELTAIWVNKNLLLGLNGSDDFTYWSGTVVTSGSPGFAYKFSMPTGARYPRERDQDTYVRCVKR